MAKRLLFDISTSMKWFGPPVGIVRVERELARWAMQNHPDCRFGFFDPDLQLYRQVLPEYLPAIFDGTAMVDTTGMADPSRSRRRRTDRVPRLLRTPFLWLTQFRRMALRTLGGMLLKSRSAGMRDIIHRLQPAIAGKKYREILLGPDGRQRAIAPVNVLTGAPIPLERGDVVLFAGSNWAHSNAAAIGQWRKQLRRRADRALPRRHPVAVSAVVQGERRRSGAAAFRPGVCHRVLESRGFERGRPRCPGLLRQTWHCCGPGEANSVWLRSAGGRAGIGRPERCPPGLKIHHAGQHDRTAQGTRPDAGGLEQAAEGGHPAESGCHAGAGWTAWLAD